MTKPRSTTSTAAAALALALLLAACGAEPPGVTLGSPSPSPGEPDPSPGDPSPGDPSPGDPEPDQPPAGTEPGEEAAGRVWFELLGVSQAATGFGEIAPATDAGALAALWVEHAFEEPLPAVPFDEQVVLVYTRPQGGCPDDLAEMRLEDDRLEPTWLPWPGPCILPLLPTAFAVALHRASLPGRFTAVLREPEVYEADSELEVALPPYDGPPAPAAPEPPRRMTDAEVEALFAGHPLRRCEELPSLETEPEVDGPLSGDRDVAAVQEQRARYGLPSDEATVRERMADPDADESFGFPVTAGELEAMGARNRPGSSEDFVQDFQSRYVREHAAGTWAFLMLDQPGGGVFVVGFTADVDEHRRRLAQRYPDVPLRVVEAPASERQLRAAQEAVGALMGTGERPHVLHSGYVAYLEIGVLDPAREDLDAIAAVVDPAIACVEVIRGGL